MLWKDFANHVAHFSVSKQKLIQQAFEFGKSAHGDQKRKSGEPYFIHPVQTAITLISLKADDETVIAALLHDVPEDTAVSANDIEAHFGPTVAQLVEGVTKIKSSEIKNNPNLDDRMETIRKMIVLLETDVRIMVIKLADRLHNMQTIEFMSAKKQQQYAKETQDFFVPIADKLCMQDLRNQLADLSMKVLDPTGFSKIEELRKRYQKIGSKSKERIQTKLTQNQKTPYIHIDIEQPSWQKWQKQLDENNENIEIITLVFTCSSIGECYQLLGSLHQVWHREQLSFQDYINFATDNGYQGLHTTIILQNGKRVRCKIRTEEMDEYAHKGISTKCFDNRAEGISNYLQWTKKIDTLSENTSEKSADFWHSLRSEILKESVTIHGQDDQIAAVPEKASVLDGLFFLYGEEALYVQSAQADGAEVYLWDTIYRGARLTMRTYKHKSVRLQWLSFVHTSTSSSTIKQALSKQTTAHKIAIAKECLQAEMNLHNKGNIEEYNFKDALGKQYDQQLIDLAEGKLDAADLYTQLFVKKTINSSSKTSGSAAKKILKFSLRSDGDPVEQTVINAVSQFHVPFDEFHVEKNTSSTTGQIDFTIKSTVNAEDIALIKEHLASLGIRKISITSNQMYSWVLIAAVVFLWALNPVIGTWFLRQGVEPLSISVIRMFTFSLFSISYYVGWRLTTYNKYVHPKNIFLLSIVPALGLAGMSIFHYLALQTVPSSVHLTMLRTNLFFTIFSQLAFKQVRIKQTLGFASMCVFIGIIISIQSMNPSMALWLSALSAISYILYSNTTKSLLEAKDISYRYPVYIMNVGIIFAIIALILVVTFPTAQLLQPYTLAISLYTLVCVCIPHIIYALRKSISKHFNLWLLLEVPVAMVLESIILQTHLSYTTYFLVMLAMSTLGVYVFHAHKKL